MRLEASTQPIICNDLYSLKKEMVHELKGQMWASAERFDAAATSLRAKGRNYDKDIQTQLGRFTKTFETFQTGCFRSFMESPRFGIKEYEQEDGSFSIQL
ncbi:Uu.00g054790.m01.CDS01 [Anthostomella pinea]|uniref:Uu.00g054790.m01.CDS01 n=1 Tax=Anthostomella pinea TaxID=933095 RepID=A0AAI8VXE0_9PEZI|nr:Uu.00g054790.m01.CDS01 [Anthostomella pinea]